MTRRYWQYEPDAPFATLLGIIEAHCHPEAYDEAYEDLQKVVKRPDRGPVWYEFKDELREAIRDPNQIPAGALRTAAQYDDGSPEKFLARLWRDLYPDEPLPTA